MTNESARTVKLPLAFLGKGRFDAAVMEDGAAVDKLRTSNRGVTKGDTLTLELASSDGAVAPIRAAR